MASTPAHHASPATFTTSHAYHTPSPVGQQPVHPNELDTTMEDADEEEQHVVDDEFAFNAPTYYDLKHPEMEQRYVNNADGYFYRDEQAHTRLNGLGTPQSAPPPPAVLHTPQRAPPAVLQTPHRAPPSVLRTPQRAPPSVLHTPQRAPPAAFHTPQRTTPAVHQTPQYAPPAALQTPQRAPPSSSPFANSPHTPFNNYRDPQTAVPSEDLDADMDADDGQQQLHTEDDDRMSDGGESDATLDLEALAAGSGPASAPSARSSPAMISSVPPPPRSLGHSHSFTSSSSLLQPTQAYLLRLQAEQAARDRQHHEATEHTHAPFHPTQAKAPLLRTSQRSHSADHLRLSSTSREIQQIQEEKTRLQAETMKMREFHERVRKQRVPTNVHQRSTKQLTIPQSPFLEVGHRGANRRKNQLNQSLSSSDDGSNHAAEEPHPPLAPEQFLSRDYEYPATSTTHHKSHATNGGHQEVTVPHTPQLRTSERAAARRNVFPGDEHVDAQEQHKPDYSKMKVNGVTRPLSPQFETDRRAAQAAAYRKPIEVEDEDDKELSRKFHARPVPRTVFEQPKSSPQKAAAKPTLTKPVSPKLATSARARTIFPEEEPEKKPAPRRTGPVVPETPPLRSIQRHNAYQENMRRRQEAEEEEMRKQREFKAQPIRLTTTPPRFEGSKKPLTEVQPFALRGDRLHERAQERIERQRREDEERLRAAQQFRAMPMPVATDEDTGAAGGHHHAPARQLTKPNSPKFATNRRATERAVFEAAERERRAREEEEKRQMEEERRRQEEEEIKRMRRDELVFHARPVPTGKVFGLKASTRPLTEPESPYLQTKIRGGAAASSSTTTTAA